LRRPSVRHRPLHALVQAGGGVDEAERRGGDDRQEEEEPDAREVRVLAALELEVEDALVLRAGQRAAHSEVLTPQRNPRRAHPSS
jgi:hypothetical protein